MRRIILLALIPLVTYAAVIGYLRYEVTNRADKIIASTAPFATIEYDSVYTSPLGNEVGLDGITIIPTMTGDVFEIEMLRITAPHAGFFLGIDDDISNFQNLKGFAFELHNIEFDVDNELFAFMQVQSQNAGDNPSNDFDFERLSALGCGDQKTFMPEDYRRMGMGIIPLDVAWSIDEEAVAMHVNAENLFSFDTSIKHDETFGVKDAVLGGAFSDTTFTLRDSGYHKLRNVYCADLNDTEIAEYIDLHISLLSKNLGLQLPKETRSAYKEYMLMGGTIVLSIEPLQHVPASNLSYYSLPEVVEMLGVDITINEQWVNWADVKWNDHEQNIKSKSVATQKRDTTVKKRPSPRKNKRRTEPAFHTIPVTSAHKYIGRNAEVILHNGVTRSGRIENVNEWRVKIAVKRHSGEMSYTVKRSDIAMMKVHY
ncbi:MAG: hypothetical protein R6X15_00505 [Pseudomonadota bacterium]